MYKRCIGIEIGARQVKMAVRQGDGGYVEIAEPLPDNYVRGGKVASMGAMAGLLKGMAKRRHIAEPWCCLVLPDAVAYTRRLQMPAMTVEHLRLNLPYEFHDFIQNRREPHVFDYAVVGPACQGGKGAAPMELMATAAPKRAIEEYRQMLRQAGWRLAAAAPASFAYSGLVGEYEKRQGVSTAGDYCFVDLGYAATRILFFHGKGLEASREVERGCAQLVEAVGNERHVDSHVAEAYVKGNYQGVWHSVACRRVYEGIGVEVRRTVEYYCYRNPGRRLGEIYFSGGGSCIEEFRETVSRYAQVRPRLAKEFITGAGLREMEPSETIFSPAALGAAMGYWKPGPGLGGRLRERASQYFQRRQNRVGEA